MQRVMMTLVFVLAVVCWVLVARTAVVGWIVGGLLAVCLAAEVTLTETSVLSGQRITPVSGLVLATVVALVAGLVVEGRRAGVPRLRSGGARRVLGLVSTSLYAVLCSCGLLLVTFLVTVNGPPASTPSAAQVFPLPNGLTVGEDRDEGCSGGSQTTCTRDIQVRSTSGQSPEQTTHVVLNYLSHKGGWNLAPDGTGGWGSCRDEGWLLDRHQVCLGVETTGGQVTLTLDSSDSW